MIIGHYHSEEIWGKGGIASYIRRVSAAQRSLSHKTLYFSKQPSNGNTAEEQPTIVPTAQDLFQHTEKLGVDILHLHGGIDSLPPKHTPVVRTMHGHHPYCPSGSKYLKRQQAPCDRPYSPHGCLWGHFIDRCGSIRPQELHDHFERTWQEKATLQQIPVITVSSFLKEQMVRAGYPEKLIQVLYLFAPETANSAPPPKTETPHVVFLGRIAPEKGLEWLVRSLQRVKVPIHLDIAGEGYFEAKIQRLVQELKLDNQVTFHGWVNPKQVSDLIVDARALVFPSMWHEPGGTVAFEAMAHSRAVIMSQVGGMPEVVLHAINGLIVPPGDIDALAESLERLATDRNLATQLGEQGRKMANEQFALQGHIDKLMHIYQHAINHHSEKFQ